MISLSSLYDFGGRFVLITGAGTGLGRSFAQGLAAQGAEIICADVVRDAADETASLIRKQGGRAHPVEVDVSDPNSVSKMAVTVGRLTDGVDVLVNNAGIATPPRPTHETPVEEWDQVMGVNLRGAFLCTKAIVPLMLRRERSAIVNIASILGLVGYHPAGCAYATSKAGIVGFTRQIAVEYASQHLRANAIAPGWHEGTQLGAQRHSSSTENQRKQFEATVVARTPLGRKGRPEELFPLLAYLASDASNYVTGQVFVHDGGWTAL